MSLGILGKKLGMGQVFDAEGNRIPVTLIEGGPCLVTQVKTAATEGYNAIQVGFQDSRVKSVNKARTGHFTKAKVSPKHFVREFKLSADEVKGFQIGQEINPEFLKINDFLDVTGISKGKGFAGVMKRHHMHGLPASHGAHQAKRHGGSIGCRFPQGTIKGIRMAGHMGTEKVTVQNLRLVEVRDNATNANQKILAIAGAVPGARGAYVYIRKAVKMAGKPAAKTN